LGGEHDPWRRRLERRNSRWRGWLEARPVLPSLRRLLRLRGMLQHWAIGLGLPLLVVAGVLVLFPLARELRASPCEALAVLRLRTGAAAWPDARAPLPAAACLVAYWRHL
jgi:hypothetical protein